MEYANGHVRECNRRGRDVLYLEGDKQLRMLTLFIRSFLHDGNCQSLIPKARGEAMDLFEGLKKAGLVWMSNRKPVEIGNAAPR